MAEASFRSSFARVFDVVVYGGGYAGFAAASSLKAAGKDVLLVDRRGDLLWESGRAFMPTGGSSADAAWGEWRLGLEACNGAEGDEIDGATAEVLATDLLCRREIPVLYYASPIAIEREGELVASVIVATKAGPRRLAARQWIDASDEAELLRLWSPALTYPAPAGLSLFVYHQHHEWPDLGTQEVSPVGDGQIGLEWRPTRWPTQRCLAISLPGSHPAPRQAIIPALKSLQAAFPEAVSNAVASHCSIAAYPHYDDVSAAAPAAVNLACAAPGKTLADRFDLGLAAAAELADRPGNRSNAALLAAPLAPIEPAIEVKADVVVAGAGSGGALAALAAAREGASVACIEALAFPGGIGAGGGIHWYYFGYTGGLQEEVDAKVEEAMPLFGAAAQVHGFHPEAKKLALAEMLAAAKVDLRTSTMLYAVKCEGRRVRCAMASTPSGPARLLAPAWVDGTGDGDLCAMAGAEFVLGRSGDGLPHAYSQSSGRFALRDELAGMVNVNFDAGWVDPTDSEDLTRARVRGIRLYVRERYDNDTRPTYIAPAIGLRQGRQVCTDQTLTLDDLVERRRFPDAVGFTGSHYDNHAVDLEFESDEGLFWVWVCRQWHARLASEIPYGMIVPKDLDNVWIGCRAAGVSDDAHYCVRMQRDIQRLGEIAGQAAALLESGRTAHEPPSEVLRQRLSASGATDLEQSHGGREFGPRMAPQSMDCEATVQAGLAALAAGQPSSALWQLYRADERPADAVCAHLQDANPKVSWLAAAVLAMWGDERAEPRLLAALADREYGFEDAGDAPRPEKNNWLVSNWLVAAALLRSCGTEQCLEALEALAADSELPLNGRTAVALTVERLLARGVPLPMPRVEALAARLLAGRIPGAVGLPQRNVQQEAEPVAAPGPPQLATEDHSWQLHLAVLRVRLALGQEIDAAAKSYLADDRALVRRAFAGAAAAKASALAAAS